jgi:hypothetical protein
MRFVAERKPVSERGSSSDGALVRGNLQILVKEAFQLISTKNLDSIDTFVKWYATRKREKMFYFY